MSLLMINSCSREEKEEHDGWMDDRRRIEPLVRGDGVYRKRPNV